MSREIKFRGFSKDLNKWVYGDLLHLEKDFVKYCSIIDWAQENANVRVEDGSVGQWTGLKDKNRKEIWEGDILKSCDDASNGTKFYYIVEWGHHAWSVRHYTIKRIHSVTSNYFFSGSQVIGDIYRNPELLSSNNF